MLQNGVSKAVVLFLPKSSGINGHKAGCWLTVDNCPGFCTTL